MGEETIWEMTFMLDKEQIKCFYITMAKAHKNWPGGEPFEQELLGGLRDEAWKLLLETQFE